MAERRNVTRKCVVAADAELDQRTVMKDDERDVRSIKPDNNIDELTSAKKVQAKPLLAVAPAAKTNRVQEPMFSALRQWACIALNRFRGVASTAWPLAREAIA